MQFQSPVVEWLMSVAFQVSTPRGRLPSTGSHSGCLCDVHRNTLLGAEMIGSTLKKQG